MLSFQKTRGPQASVLFRAFTARSLILQSEGFQRNGSWRKGHHHAPCGATHSTSYVLRSDCRNTRRHGPHHVVDLNVCLGRLVIPVTAGRLSSGDAGIQNSLID